MTLQSELKISEDELKALQMIAQTHPYFPELALDDYLFINNFKGTMPPKIIKSLEEKFLINVRVDNITLVKTFAKEYWNDIINSIPITPETRINRDFLKTRDIKVLKEAYHTLTYQSPVGLSKDDLIDEILKFYEPGEKEMAKTQGEKTKKVAKEVEVKEEVSKGLTPKQAAEQTGIKPSIFRKMLRRLYGKTEGSWSLTEKQVEEVEKAYHEYQQEVSKNRSERMAKLQEARKAKAAKKSK